MIFSKIRQLLKRGKSMEVKQEMELDADGKVIGMAQVPVVKPTFKKKRDIFRFQGEKDIGVNLEHVTNMYVEGKRITFQFYSTSTFVDLDDDAAAKRAYEHLLAVWSADAGE